MAAANEISQRISLRQQTQIAFVVGVFTVLGWILPGLNDKHTDKAYQLLCALIPMVGIIFTCWTGQNDLVVGLLCSFCRACQQAHDGFTSDGTRPSKPDPWLTPNWFSRTQVWAVQGYLYRALGNVAYSAILFCTTIPMSLVILKNFSGPNDGPAIAIFQVFVSALLLV